MAPQYLCILDVVTARGFSSGHEEIVLLVYVIINVAERRIVGAQQHIVKTLAASTARLPSLSNISTETSLTEEMITNGKPLRDVLTIFDNYLRDTLHISTSPDSFRLVTDGQMPLRHYLHPETFGKYIFLPSYYNTFHDLRKEFRKMYVLSDDIKTLSDIISYLDIVPASTSEYYSQNMAEMVSVTLKLIEDGDQFENPEYIILDSEVPVCTAIDECDQNCFVFVKHLQRDEQYYKVINFFRGLHIAEDGVAFVYDVNEKFQESVVRFVDEEHRDLALLRHGHSVGKQSISVHKASKDIFTKENSSQKNRLRHFKSKEGQVFKMTNFPHYWTPPTILKYFNAGKHSCKLKHDESGVFIITDPRNLSQQTAFVLFNKEDKDKVAKRNGQVVGNFTIRLSQSSMQEFKRTFGNLTKCDMNERPLPVEDVIISGQKRKCVHTDGVPVDTHVGAVQMPKEKRERADFIGMPFNGMGKPLGHALFDMKYEENARCANRQDQFHNMNVGEGATKSQLLPCTENVTNQCLTNASAGHAGMGYPMVQPGAAQYNTGLQTANNVMYPWLTNASAGHAGMGYPMVQPGAAQYNTGLQTTNNVMNPWLTNASAGHAGMGYPMVRTGVDQYTTGLQTTNNVMNPWLTNASAGHAGMGYPMVRTGVDQYTTGLQTTNNVMNPWLTNASAGHAGMGYPMVQPGAAQYNTGMQTTNNVMNPWLTNTSAGHAGIGYPMVRTGVDQYNTGLQTANNVMYPWLTNASAGHAGMGYPMVRTGVDQYTTGLQTPNNVMYPWLTNASAGHAGMGFPMIQPGDAQYSTELPYVPYASRMCVPLVPEPGPPAMQPIRHDNKVYMYCHNKTTYFY